MTQRQVANGDWKGLFAEARRQGWVEKPSKNHVKYVSPQGRLVVVPCTASDHRAWLNSRAQFRRAGLDI